MTHVVPCVSTSFNLAKTQLPGPTPTMINYLAAGLMVNSMITYERNFMNTPDLQCQ